VVSGRIVTIAFVNYLQDEGVRPGANAVRAHVEQLGNARVERVVRFTLTAGRGTLVRDVSIDTEYDARSLRPDGPQPQTAFKTPQGLGFGHLHVQGASARTFLDRVLCVERRDHPRRVDLGRRPPARAILENGEDCGHRPHPRRCRTRMARDPAPEARMTRQSGASETMRWGAAAAVVGYLAGMFLAALAIDGGSSPLRSPLLLLGLASMSVAVGLAVRRWWALLLPVAAVALAIPLGEPDPGEGEIDSWVILLFTLPVLVAGVALGLLGAAAWRRRLGSPG
jgi:hypothetical protein